MRVDALVHFENPASFISSGTDWRIYREAGHELLEARKKIGNIRQGHAAVTPGFSLPVKYVIHTVMPARQGGKGRKESSLEECIREVLKLARKHKCGSVAVLESNGFSGLSVRQTVLNAIRNFLMKKDMTVYLVESGGGVWNLPENRMRELNGYLALHYIREETDRAEGSRFLRGKMYREKQAVPEQFAFPASGAASAAVLKQKPERGANSALEALLERTDAGFSDTLLKLIDHMGKKDSEIYKRANVDRKLFSKIRTNPDYRPSKPTAVAFAIALELDLEETKDLIARAGYALSHSSKFDIIIEYFIIRKEYNIDIINETLFYFDQTLLGT